MQTEQRLKRVYLDVETYRPAKELGFVGETLILIGLLEEGQREPKFFENPEGREEGERSLLVEFYDYLEGLKRNGSRLEIVGFNILRYDVPLLIAKSVKHGVTRELTEVFKQYISAHDAEIISKFWHGIYIIDLQQVLLLFNELRFKDLKLRTLPSLLKGLFPSLNECVDALSEVETISEVDGEKIAEWFREGKFSSIKMKNEEDLRVVRATYTCVKSIASYFSRARSSRGLYLVM